MYDGDAAKAASPFWRENLSPFCRKALSSFSLAKSGQMGYNKLKSQKR